MTLPPRIPAQTTATPTSGYQDLHVWKLAVELAIESYQQTARFPFIERFGLTAQIRRAAVSVVSNIAEGQGRRSPRAFAYHLSIARGSVKELEAQFVIAERLGYIEGEELTLIREYGVRVGSMLARLQWAMESKPADRA